MENVCIIMPLFNDWKSAAILIPRIDQVVAGWDCRVALVVVDDGSLEPMPAPAQLIGAGNHIAEVRVIHLARNQGHQRAIAVGLAYAHSRQCFSSVFVMDSDGEDPPDELADLRHAGRRHPEAIITADRASRSEGPLFRMGYRCYRLVFRLLTGTAIRFGNFCHIPAHLLDRLVHYDDLWNSFSGCIKKSRLPVVGTPSHRAKRYIGPSKMNLMALILHGLCAVAVFQETVMVRLLVAAGALTGLVLLAAAAGGGLYAALPVLGLAGPTIMVLLALTLGHLHGRSRLRQGPAAFWQSQVRSISTLREG